MTMNNIHSQRGLTLVELMVAMTLQLVLLVGVGQIFLGQKQTYLVSDAFARMQENGRYAIGTLQHDIRAAGYTGCRTLSDLSPNIIANNPPDYSTVGDAVQGWDAGQWTASAIGLSGSSGITPQTATTDAILISSVSSSGANLTGNMAANNANIQISSNPDNLEAGDAILISDCENADLFRASSVSSGGTITIAHAQNVNSDNKLSKPYGTNATVLKFSSRTFFIGVSAADPDQRPTLYMIEFDNATPQPLVSDVQEFQVFYQIDTNADGVPDSSVAAGAVTDWANVLGVRIGLLLRTDNNLAVDPQAITFNGANANPGNDLRLRYAFWSSVAIRNRLQ